jgi:uncharacterized membrane protein
MKSASARFKESHMQKAILFMLMLGAPVSLASAQVAEPSIVVTPATTDKGEVTHVRASIRINAPPANVWATITDCARAPRIIPHLESCRLIERDPAGRWDVREHVINPPLLPKMRTIVRNEFTPSKRLSFRLLSGDMKTSDGAWTLQPDKGGTILSYDAFVAPNFAAPQFLVSRSISNDFPRMLRAIAKASQDPSF